MLHRAGFYDELERSEPARAAMALLEGALARRSMEEQGAFWRAVDIYYLSRKAPPEPVAETVPPSLPTPAAAAGGGL